MYFYKWPASAVYVNSPFFSRRLSTGRARRPPPSRSSSKCGKGRVVRLLDGIGIEQCACAGSRKTGSRCRHRKRWGKRRCWLEYVFGLVSILGAYMMYFACKWSGDNGLIMGPLSNMTQPPRHVVVVSTHDYPRRPSV